jgi:hypothetical protein
MNHLLPVADGNDIAAEVVTAPVPFGGIIANVGPEAPQKLLFFLRTYMQHATAAAITGVEVSYSHG